jgi:hypothetical protein
MLTLADNALDERDDVGAGDLAETTLAPQRQNMEVEDALITIRGPFPAPRVLDHEALGERPERPGAGFLSLALTVLERVVAGEHAPAELVSANARLRQRQVRISPKGRAHGLPAPAIPKAKGE